MVKTATAADTLQAILSLNAVINIKVWISYGRRQEGFVKIFGLSSMSMLLMKCTATTDQSSSALLTVFIHSKSNLNVLLLAIDCLSGKS